MPRVRVEELRISVSIPQPTPVCPRCLDIEPGAAGGDPNSPHPGPFSDDLCVPCRLAVAKDRTTTMPAVERLAAYAIAVRPLQPWPRPGMPNVPDGPSRLALGPRDFEGQGREAFWNQTPEERAMALAAMVEDAGINCSTKADIRYLGVVSERKAFARGWLFELQSVSDIQKRRSAKSSE